MGATSHHIHAVAPLWELKGKSWVGLSHVPKLEARETKRGIKVYPSGWQCTSIRVSCFHGY